MAGLCAALLVFASPVVGIDGTSAYNDVAVAAIAFTLFYLLQIWDEDRTWRLAAAIGLVAGFAFAAKYTAWPAVVYALGFVLLKNRKAALPVAVCAAIAIAPWLLKNWIYFQNPLAPFYNRQFPNPFVMAGFEDTYRKLLAMYHLKSRWQIPMEVTTYGSLSGLLGPVFLSGATGADGAPPARREAALARRAGLRRELLQQYLGPLPDSAATVRRAGDDAGAQFCAATGGRGGGAVGGTLLAGDCAALRPSRCVAPGRNSVARGVAHPAGRPLPGAAPHALPVRPADRAKHRARFHGVYLRADSGSLHLAPHPRGIPVGGQSDCREDSVDGGRAGVCAHLASALPLSATNAARASRGANQSGRRYMEHSRIPCLPGRYAN